MSLNLVSRLALAFGALTVATLPAFAETSATAAAPNTTVASPAVKHHAKKAAVHHKKAVKKEAVEKTSAAPATPTDAGKPKL